MKLKSHEETEQIQLKATSSVHVSVERTVLEGSGQNGRASYYRHKGKSVCINKYCIRTFSLFSRWCVLLMKTF